MIRFPIHRHLPACLRAALFTLPVFSSLALSSCWINTSGKLDASGKHIEAYYINTAQPAAQVFEQQGRYYIKAPRLRLHSTTPMYTYISDPSSYTCEATTGWAYHEIFVYDKKALPLPGQSNLPMPEPDAPWVPAHEFEAWPFTVLGNKQTPAAPQPGTQISANELKASSVHRSAGNILRLPLVGLAACAIDLPVMFVTAIPAGIYELRSFDWTSPIYSDSSNPGTCNGDHDDSCSIHNSGYHSHNCDDHQY